MQERTQDETGDLGGIQGPVLSSGQQLILMSTKSMEPTSLSIPESCSQHHGDLHLALRNMTGPAHLTTAMLGT